MFVLLYCFDGVWLLVCGVLLVFGVDIDVVFGGWFGMLVEDVVWLCVDCVV